MCKVRHHPKGLEGALDAKIGRQQIIRRFAF